VLALCYLFGTSGLHIAVDLFIVLILLILSLLSLNNHHRGQTMNDEPEMK